MTAVKVGASWWILEGSAVPQRAQEDAEWLMSHDSGSQFAGAITTTPTMTQGGHSWLLSKGYRVIASRNTRRSATAVLGNWDATTRSVTFVDRGRWLVSGADSLWVEGVDLPGTPGALVVWVPSLRWIYSAPAASPLARNHLMAHAAARGWNVERIGSARAVAERVPPGR